MLDADAEISVDDDTPGDETMYPSEGANRRTIIVTVDGAPYMGDQSESSIDLTEIGAANAVKVGTVYDPEGVPKTIDRSRLSTHRTVEQSAARVEVALGMAVDAKRDAALPAYRPTEVTGRNAGYGNGRP